MLIENAAPSHLVPAREIAADDRPHNALFLCMFLAVTWYELSATDDAATFEITCADPGIDMSPEFQQHAFQPFAQEAKAGTSTYTGSGLGLAIVKELVERMGGTISLESEEGVGSTFTVVVPFEIDHNATEACGQSAPGCGVRGYTGALLHLRRKRRRTEGFACLHCTYWPAEARETPPWWKTLSQARAYSLTAASANATSFPAATRPDSTLRASRPFS